LGRRIFADAIGQADLLDSDDFAQYGITGQALDDIRSRLAACRRELRDESSSAWSHEPQRAVRDCVESRSRN
jgi:hypothetical protein